MLHLDFETYSEANLIDYGAFRYAMDLSTEILCASWADGAGAVQTWSILDRQPPARLLAALRDGEDIIAHNAQFEFAILKYVATRQGWPEVKYSQMHCTAARAAMLGLPRGLAHLGAALRLPEQKDREGGRLIRLFCLPQRDGSRVHPRDRPAEFRSFLGYNAQDVRTEQAADRALPQLPAIERRAFLLDLQINDRGVPVDVAAASRALGAYSHRLAKLRRQGTTLMGGIAPTQRDKVLAWLRERGLALPNLTAGVVDATVSELEDQPKADPEVLQALRLRREASYAAPKKLEAITGAAVEGRVRGTILYCGAHTGRWSGTIIQPQNFPRGEEHPWLFALLESKNLHDAAAIADAMELIHPRPIQALSEAMRGFIAAPPGYELAVIDYSQIEARILCWLCGQADMVLAFAAGADPYRIMASRLYGIPPAQVTDEQRRIGKNLVLGCGFGLGAARFVEYCAGLGVRIDGAFARLAVETYRKTHPQVTAGWRVLENTVLAALRQPGVTMQANLAFRLRVRQEGGWMRIQLPSGRCLWYGSMQYGPDEDGQEHLTYLSGRYGRVHTYGGHLMENVVQAIARDVMLEGMFAAEEAGYPVVLTVHDELVNLAPEGANAHTTLAALASRPLPAYPGLPIAAKGFSCRRYRTD